ncbi:hypothetical protein PIB30_050672, partial [Stylosanthes scabra]|nr:hypothetical protein [Stylosanthes scabra]
MLCGVSGAGEGCICRGWKLQCVRRELLRLGEAASSSPQVASILSCSPQARANLVQ